METAVPIGSSGRRSGGECSRGCLIVSRVERIPLAAKGRPVSGPRLCKASPPADGKAANEHGRPARPDRTDWLEVKLKRLYDETAQEPLPPSLQKLIDALDG